MLYPEKNLGKVCVLGFGKSGIALARYFADLLDESRARVAEANEALIDELVLYAGPSGEKAQVAAAEFVARGIPVIFDTEEIEGDFDLCVASPGIPPHSTFHKRAAQCCREVLSEPEFAYRLCPEHWVGITGTNGKSTTTMLVAHLINACGTFAREMGNIGDPCVNVVNQCAPGTWYSVELSSCQLEFIDTLTVEAGILLNITPDHIKWHGSMEAYAAAKIGLFSRMPADAPIAVVALAENTRELYRQWRDEGRFVIPIGSAAGIYSDMVERCGSANSAFVDEATGRLVVRLADTRYELAHVDELNIKGEHNWENALSAAAVLLALGFDATAITEGLRTFYPLEHRIEPCGVHEGVAYFNDSKATNPEAVLKALTAFEPGTVHILLGGTDKGTGLDELVEVCLSSCKSVICYGASHDRFMEAFERGLERYETTCALYDAVGMADALTLATSLAEAGESVLLSPACASFDEFNSFEHRGEVFKQLVAEL